MLKTFVLFGLSLFFASPSRSEEISPADRERIESSIRKAISVRPDWAISLKEVKPSPFEGLLAGAVEFKMGDNTRFQSVFISTDFKKYIVGNSFDATEDSDKVRMEKIRLEGSPSLGPANAKVTIVEYSDLQCPSCKNAHESFKVDNILKSYPGKVRLVYKNKPFARSHDWALNAAVAAMCAQRQNPKAFWSVLDDIYLHQSSITAANLWSNVSAYAKRAGLKADEFKKCFDSQETLPEVNSDVAEAEAIGVAQTPTFFVNGRVVVGYPGAQNLRTLIDEFLGAATK